MKNSLKRDWKSSSPSQPSSQLSPNTSSALGVKPKRVRTIFTPEQLERLEQEFERQQYMVGTERYYLASSLNLSEAQVKVWFQNRRIKWRKQHLEQQHVAVAGLHMSAITDDVGGREEQEGGNRAKEEREEEEEVDLELRLEDSEAEEDLRSLASSLRSSPGLLVSVTSPGQGQGARGVATGAGTATKEESRHHLTYQQ
jgi:hypothetical protein